MRIGASLARLAILTTASCFAACGSGGQTAPVRYLDPTCPPGSAWDGQACTAFARRSVERLVTPWVVHGTALTLELVVYKPLPPAPAGGRYPTVVFHHGSTGNGDDPARFRMTFDSQSLAREFTRRGFMVLFPQRRGRGQSDGIYDEGFEPDRARYACQQGPAWQGLERALEDAEVVTTAVLARSDVDPSRMFLGGVSRGGVLALVHAARSSAGYCGIINFVGGWLGDACSDAAVVNRAAFVSAASAPIPSLWIYASGDPFYSLPVSRSHFDAFLAAGGTGRWLELRRSDASASGHLVYTEPALWSAAMTAFLAPNER